MIPRRSATSPDPSTASSTRRPVTARSSRQICPDADLISIRVADSQGTLLEGEFLEAVRAVAELVIRDARGLPGGRPIDVLNLSLSYYHETPEDGQFDQTLVRYLVAARRHGCAVVCSAGNDATSRPAFPAALWRWPDAEFVVDDPSDAAPHLSVGALNPNGKTVALFSNIGRWVRVYAPGAAVVSSAPPLNGGTQAGTRNDRFGLRRETIDPDDYTGGFVMWSGTSFAAPFIAGLLAERIADGLIDGTADTSVAARVSALEKAGSRALREWDGHRRAPA